MQGARRPVSGSCAAASEARHSSNIRFFSLLHQVRHSVFGKIFAYSKKISVFDDIFTVSEFLTVSRLSVVAGTLGS
jgi:hypothetical protein